MTNRLMRTVNKIAVLWEDLKNLLNKANPSYREIRPMRGPPVLSLLQIFLSLVQKDVPSLTGKKLPFTSSKTFWNFFYHPRG